MHKITRWALASVGFALVLAPASLWAQSVLVRVRGTIERVDGETLTVKSRDGGELKIALAANATAAAVAKASPGDIKKGLYVGVVGMPQTDGRERAIEVHIFPDAMRGVGEGHRPWDLQPQSTMTNANVEQTVAAVDGQTLTLKYKDGEQKVVVSPETEIVTYVPGDTKELKPGVKIFISGATKQPDGTLTAVRINYGKDGLTPPM